MPIYEYYCPTCRVRFEMLRSFSRADDPASCPTCTDTGRRVISNFASFSKGANGEMAAVGGGGGCGCCSGGNCGSCH